jgi:hypothetical protein
MAESDDVPVTEPEKVGPRSRPTPVKPRPVWMDALFAGSVALAFGLSLVHTPTAAAVAALVFLLGSVAYAILRIRWARRQSRPTMMPARTADGVLYLGVLLVAFLLSGVEVGNQLWQNVYAAFAGLLIGVTGLFLLRREEARQIRQ